MAASAGVNIIVELLGLGGMQSFVKRFTLGETPTESHYNYRIQEAKDEEELLALGSVSTVDLIAIKAVTEDMIVDTSYDTAFSTEIIIPKGEIALFKPVGTLIYVMNRIALKQCSYEYIVIGR